MIPWLLLFFSLRMILAYPGAFPTGEGSIKVCEEKECVEAANHILKWMNPEYPPCEDFYEFTCGYWHSPDNKTINKQHNQSLAFNNDLVAEYLKILMKDKKALKETTLFTELLNFFNLCMDEDSINTLGVSPALEVLQIAGGWPVLDEEWTGEDWDLLEAHIHLKQSLIGLILGYHDHKVTLGVAVPSFYEDYPSYDEEKTEEEIQKYFKKMCDFAVAFGANRIYAETELKETLEFQLALEELGSSTNESYRDDVFYNMSTLQTEIPWVDWTRLIKGVLPESVIIKDSDEIFVRKPKFLKELGPFIDSFPKKVVANYVMWRAASSMANFLTPEIANIMQPSNATRYEYCLQVLKTSRFSPIIAYYVATDMSEDIETAKEIAKEIKQQLLMDIEKMSWLDEESREQATEVITNTTVTVSFPEEFSDINKLKSFYKEVQMEFTSFFEASWYMKKWQVSESFKSIGESSFTIGFPYNVQEALSIEAYMGGNVVVSPGMLHILPLFNSKLPRYVTYAHLGGILAHEMTHAIDMMIQGPASRINEMESHWLPRNDETYHKNYNHISFRWGSNETEELYEEKSKCVINQYDLFNDTKTTKLKLNGRLTNSEDIADLGGLKLALHTYRRVSAQMTTPEPLLPHLEQYTIEQLFMISAANTYCVIPDYEKYVKSIKTNSHSLWEFRVKGMMMNSPDFNKAFQCKSGDPMNPSDKCEVW